MAEATIDQIVTALAELLRTELDGVAIVEDYLRVDPPTQLTVYVHPQGDGAETGLHITDDCCEGTFQRHRVHVIIEAPWTDGVAGYEAVIAVRRIVHDVILAARDLTIADVDDPADGRDEGCEYQFVKRRGQANDNWSAWVTASWRV